MAEYDRRVYISYAWGGESGRIASELESELSARGIVVVRDTRDLAYRGSIAGFMEEIGRGHAVVVIISDKYLRSSNCMFELIAIAKNANLHERIFPVVLQDADIYDPLARLNYIEHWKGKKDALNAKLSSLGEFENLQGITDDLNSYDEIRDQIAMLTSTLKDMNTLTPEMHESSNFAALATAIELRLKADTSADGVTPTQRPSGSARDTTASTGALADVEMMFKFVHGIVESIVKSPAQSYAIMTVRGSVNRFIQVVAFPTGDLAAEVASNEVLDDEEQWSDAQLEQLDGLGWIRPHEGTDNPNHYIDWPDACGSDPEPVIDLVSKRMATTLVDVFGITSPGRLRVTTEDT